MRWDQSQLNMFTLKPRTSIKAMLLNLTSKIHRISVKRFQWLAWRMWYKAHIRTTWIYLTPGIAWCYKTHDVICGQNLQSRDMIQCLPPKPSLHFVIWCYDATIFYWPLGVFTTMIRVLIAMKLSKISCNTSLYTIYTVCYMYIYLYLRILITAYPKGFLCRQDVFGVAEILSAKYTW